MAKFKVGDKVRVRSDLNGKDRYYNEDKKTWDDCVSEMLDLRGKTVTITEVVETGKYRICEAGYSWTDEMFTEPHREFIVLRRDGAKTIAELWHDREIIKSAVATCSENDTFDFETGAKLAFDRLIGRDEPNHAPHPAHRFKVGDRVVSDEFKGVGEVSAIDENDDQSEYLVFCDGGTCSGYAFDVKPAKPEHIGRCTWVSENRLSPAPAPEPPKFYTGKVQLSKSCGCYECGAILGSTFSIDNGFGVERPMWGEPFTSFADFVSKRHNKEWHEVKSDV